MIRLFCSDLSAYGFKRCCTSCHEDNEQFGTWLCGPSTDDMEADFCCNGATFWDGLSEDVKKEIILRKLNA